MCLEIALRRIFLTSLPIGTDTCPITSQYALLRAAAPSLQGQLPHRQVARFQVERIACQWRSAVWEILIDPGNRLLQLRHPSILHQTYHFVVEPPLLERVQWKLQREWLPGSSATEHRHTVHTAQQHDRTCPLLLPQLHQSRLILGCRVAVQCPVIAEYGRPHHLPHMPPESSRFQITHG